MVQENALFLSQASVHPSFTFNLQFLYELNHKVRLSKPGYFHTAIHSFTHRPLIFNLQQEVLKFSDIYVSWSSPNTDQVTIF